LVDDEEGVDEGVDVSLFVDDSPADFFSPSFDDESDFDSPSPAAVDEAALERPPA